MANVKKFAALLCCLLVVDAFGVDIAHAAPRPAVVRSRTVQISTECGANCLWSFSANGTHPFNFTPPVFRMEGGSLSGRVTRLRQSRSKQHLINGVTEYSLQGTVADDPHLKLEIAFQLSDESPVVRFRYTLSSDRPRRLTSALGANQLTYLTASFREFSTIKEIAFSQFNELTHSYTLAERELDPAYFDGHTSMMGPMLVGTNEKLSFLLAYEHGSQSPDAFLHYDFEKNRSVRLSAVKGNYVSNQIIDGAHPFHTVWFDTAAVAGGIAHLASAYRRFVSKSMTLNQATRRPFIFYNTWNFQERNRWWNHHSFLDSMNQDRMLKEIDVAHRMGIEVFVLDTGWYSATGDWNVDLNRFPDGLKAVKEKLDSYGMQLGLWFGPTSASISSQAVLRHPEWRMSWHGNIRDPQEIWGTERSYDMCLVSPYADAFADELIRLAQTLGVTYFKWDAIGQYGCDDAHHSHGGESNTAQERADSYGFKLIQQLAYIADKVSTAVPGAIVDFDMTEAGRPMGLAFLSAGRYFLLNNGPYLASYDIPQPEDVYSNLFVYPGAARTWIARYPLSFDRWFPSNLLLTHYLPDDPIDSQEINVASLILGQDGIWGDLLSVSEPGIEYIHKTLNLYKQVRDDMADSDPVTSGAVSGSPEIHEKLSSTTGRGAVVVFATATGAYSYVTTHSADHKTWSSDGAEVTWKPDGKATITWTFSKPGSKIIFFGIHSSGAK